MRSLLLAAALSLSACAPATPVAMTASAEVPPPYEREAFGDGWASTGHGCDTRDQILARDVRDVTNADRCGPLAGTLTDPYSGVIVVGPTRQLDVDHRVPLALAFRLGAWRWTQAERERFANDTAELVATTARSNRSKGDRGLEWLPAVDPCGYARAFDEVGDRYGLVDPKRDGEVASACR